MNRKTFFAEIQLSPVMVIWFNEIEIGSSELYYFSTFFIDNTDIENNFDDIQC